MSARLFSLRARHLPLSGRVVLLVAVASLALATTAEACRRCGGRCGRISNYGGGYGGYAGGSMVPGVYGVGYRAAPAYSVPFTTMRPGLFGWRQRTFIPYSAMPLTAGYAPAMAAPLPVAGPETYSASYGSSCGTTAAYAPTSCGCAPTSCDPCSGATSITSSFAPTTTVPAITPSSCPSCSSCPGGVCANYGPTDGTIIDGTIIDGTISGETIIDGTIVDGTVIDGTIIDGTIIDGTVLPSDSSLPIEYPYADPIADPIAPTRADPLDPLQDNPNARPYNPTPNTDPNDDFMTPRERPRTFDDNVPEGNFGGDGSGFDDRNDRNRPSRNNDFNNGYDDDLGNGFDLDPIDPAPRGGDRSRNPQFERPQPNPNRTLPSDDFGSGELKENRPITPSGDDRTPNPLGDELDDTDRPQPTPADDPEVRLLRPSAVAVTPSTRPALAAATFEQPVATARRERTRTVLPVRYRLPRHIARQTQFEHPGAVDTRIAAK